MTTGIYRLNFGNRATYIGQSINVEARWKQHFDKFRKGTAAKKMQDAYNLYGFPEAGIIVECHKDYLDLLENFLIYNDRQHSNNNLNATASVPEQGVDYDWLIDNAEKLLVNSQYQNIRTMCEFADAISTQSDQLKYAEERFNDAYIKELVRTDAKKNHDLVKQLVPELKAAETKLLKIQSRGLIKRIFNYD